MDKIIPALPCPDIKAQVDFYKFLGFELLKLYPKPNAYAVMKYGEMELHFYGLKKLPPSENFTTCIMQVDDVDRIYEAFSSGLKGHLGKIPRAGIPKITKVRDLRDDRRFTLTDTGGNTFYVCMPHTNEKHSQAAFFRKIDSEDYGEKYTILYDLLYSKEDAKSAYNMLVKHFPADLSIMHIPEMDMAKMLLLVLSIHLQKSKTINEDIHNRLKALLDNCDPEDAQWKNIGQKYLDSIEL